MTIGSGSHKVRYVLVNSRISSDYISSTLCVQTKTRRIWTPGAAPSSNPLRLEFFVCTHRIDELIGNCYARNTCERVLVSSSLKRIRLTGRRLTLGANEWRSSDESEDRNDTFGPQLKLQSGYFKFHTPRLADRLGKRTTSCDCNSASQVRPLKFGDMLHFPQTHFRT